MILTDSGEAYKINIEPQIKVLVGTNIKYLSCNNTMACLISISGQILVVGKDPLQLGLLGISECFETSLTPIMDGIHGIGVSVGLSHVGLLDRSGNIYTWGSGIHGELGIEQISKQQLPTIVQSAKIFSVKQILCGYNYTAICTSGGFVYIYGSIAACPTSSVKAKTSHYSVKGLEKLFVQQIVGCKDYVAVLTDNKDAYIFHDCLKVVKLPSKYKLLAGCESVLYALPKDESFLHV